MKFYLDAHLADEEIIGKYKIEALFGQSELNLKSYIISEDEVLYKDRVVGLIIKIDSPEDMEEALKIELDINHSMIIVQTGDWHIIPLENLIAKFAKSDVTLIATASTPQEVELLKNILELGVDGCYLHPSEKYSIEELLETETDQKRLDLHKFQISGVKRIGNGDRVCVDTVSILQDGEGLLVGSTAVLQLLVQAEVEETGFVNARPFRINAGVVASYVMNFDKTNYLSELKAGSTVMIVRRDGTFRKEYVARVKIERRPLVIIKVTHENQEYSVLLQDAETVKLVTSESSKRVDKLQEGDEVLGLISTEARHFGMAINEFLEER